MYSQGIWGYVCHQCQSCQGEACDQGLYLVMETVEELQKAPLLPLSELLS
jgi:hypothetical protein